MAEFEVLSEGCHLVMIININFIQVKILRSRQPAGDSKKLKFYRVVNKILGKKEKPLLIVLFFFGFNFTFIKLNWSRYLVKNVKEWNIDYL